MQAASSLASLADRLPESKSGCIRALLPTIEQLRARGHQSKAIWVHLHAAGLAISYDAFRVYLRRARLRRSSTAVSTAIPARPIPIQTARAPVAAGERVAPKVAATDPFGGVRESRNRNAREGFDYDPLMPLKENLLR